MSYEKKKITKPRPKTQQEAVAPELQGYIDLVRSELFEEQSSPLAESEYTDDTHNWGDTKESEEYWHFVGRYE